MTESAAPPHPAGLCAECRHHRVTGNRRGSRFYLCELASTDTRFRRYPPLPVLECAGFEQGGPDPWAAYRREGGEETRVDTDVEGGGEPEDVVEEDPSSGAAK